MVALVVCSLQLFVAVEWWWYDTPLLSYKHCFYGYLGFNISTVTLQNKAVRAELMDSSTILSCHVGITCEVFLSSLSTWWMAASCSRIQAMLEQSVTIECSESPFSIWAIVSSCFFPQLYKNDVTIFLHTPTALETLTSSLLEFVTTRFKLWPKQESRVQPSF